MATTLLGVYRAVCLDVTDVSVRCKIPQLFADETVTCFDVAGTRPVAGAEGFVAFEGGWPDRPVWIGQQWELRPAEGASLIGVWTYDTPTTMANPGNGKVRTPVDNSQMALSKWRRDGTDVSNVLSLIVTDDTITFQEKANSDNWGRFTVVAPVVDNGDWFLITVSPIESHGTPIAKNTEVTLNFTLGAGGGGGGGGGVDEVWVGATPPPGTQELWYDTGAATPADVPGPPGPGVITGGTTDQVLAKASATDYATKWSTLPLSTLQAVTLTAASLATSTGADANITGSVVVAAVPYARHVIATWSMLVNTVTAVHDIYLKPGVQRLRVPVSNISYSQTSVELLAANTARTYYCAVRSLTGTGTFSLQGGGDLSFLQVVTIPLGLA